MSQDSRLSRRQFLERASAAAVTAHPVGRALAQSPQAPILGEGSHRYRCVHDWLTPPSGMLFGDTHGLAQDSKGRIYVAHTVHGQSSSADAVCVYDERGRFLKSWGAQFRGGAHGLDLRREGDGEYLYHCDTGRGKVVKTDLDGKVVFELGAPLSSARYGRGEGFVPTNVAFAPDGDFYVADGYGRHWIHQYDRNGNYRRTFGGPGNGKGQVSCPHGLWVDPRGREPMLVVADRSNRRLQIFDLDGKHVRFVTEGMRLPCHFSVRNDMLLIPDLESVVTIVDPDYKVIAHLGDGHPSGLRGQPRTAFVPGKFIHPHDAIFLRNGDILVAEWVPIGRITLLQRVR